MRRPIIDIMYCCDALPAIAVLVWSRSATRRRLSRLASRRGYDDPSCTPDAPPDRAGMVGFGMIFDDTYRPVFEPRRRTASVFAATGPVDVELAAVGVADRVAGRALPGRARPAGSAASQNFAGPDAVDRLLASGVDAVCVATPDDRHFDAARAALAAGKHVLIEKPSVLTLAELDELDRPRRAGTACSPRSSTTSSPTRTTRSCAPTSPTASSSTSTTATARCWSRSRSAAASSPSGFAGRNPATYVAVHYLKLIDFTFGPDWRSTAITATGQRGLVGPAGRADLGLGAAAGRLHATPTAARRRSTSTRAG